MQLTTLISAAALVGLTMAAPAPLAPRAFTIPTDDGYPNPNDAQLAAISRQADGTLSNGPAPKVANGSLPIFQLIAFNENFEVAYFASMLQNLTSGLYDHELAKVPKDVKDDLVEIIKTILAVCKPPFSLIFLCSLLPRISTR
jgi:hypothetical protein